MQLAKQQLYDAIAHTRRGAGATSYQRGQIEEAQVRAIHKTLSCARVTLAHLVHLDETLHSVSCHAPSRGSFHRKTGSVWQ